MVDFFDYSSRRVEITVVGGTTECDTPILNWVVRATPQSSQCGAINNGEIYVDLQSAETTWTFYLGAQAYNLRIATDVGESVLLDNVDPALQFGILEDVQNYLEIQYIDVTPEQSENETELVRFEYHVRPIPEVITATTYNPDCGYIGESQEPIHFQIIYREEYYGTHICYDVEGIFNILGEPPSFVFQEEIEDIHIHNEVNITWTPMRARANAFPMTLRIETEFTDASDTALFFYIEGIMPREGVASLPLPRSEPLYILRDPPGDSSYAEFSAGNTMSVTYSATKGDGTSLTYDGNLGGGASTSLSMGFSAGFGALVNSDWEILKIGVDASISAGGSYSAETNTEASLQWDISAQETFSTSDEWTGSDYDMYLIQAWNVKVSESDIFEYINDSCPLAVHTAYTWDMIPSADDINALAWISEYQIKTMELEGLDQNLAAIVDCVTDECTMQRTQINDAVDSWNSLMELNGQLKNSTAKTPLIMSPENRLAGGGKTLRDAESSFVSDVADANHAAPLDSAFLDVAGSVLPSVGFMGGGQISHLTQSFNWRQNMGGNGHETNPGYQLIYFDGGGSSQTYTFTSEKAATRDFSLTLNEDYKKDVSFGMNMAIAAFSLNMGVKSGNSRQKPRSESTGRSEGHEISITVTFSDIDRGDSFTVAVYEDERGWYVYETVSGRSACPAEDGTISRHAYDFEISDGISLVEVYEDEPAIWELIVANNAEPWWDIVSNNAEAFILYVDYNPGGVSLFADGLPFFPFEELYPRPQTVTSKWIRAEKPPGQRTHFEIQLNLVANCFFWEFKTVQLEVEFFRHCPSIEFKMAETVTETVRTIFAIQGWDKCENHVQCEKAGYSYCSDTGFCSDDCCEYLDAVDGTCPETCTDAPGPDPRIVVRFEWRKVHAFGISDIWVRVPEFVDIDMNLNRTVDWDMSAQRDGKYDLRLATYCDGFGPVTDRDREAESEIIHFVKDLEGPRLMPFPEPQDGHYHLGDEVSFLFDEPIKCDYQARLLNSDDTVALTPETICVNEGKDGKILFEVAEFLAAQENNNMIFKAEVAFVTDLYDNPATGNFLTWSILTVDVRNVVLLSLSDSVELLEFIDFDEVHHNLHGEISTLLEISGDRLQINEIDECENIANNHNFELLSISGKKTEGRHCLSLSVSQKFVDVHENEISHTDVTAALKNNFENYQEFSEEFPLIFELVDVDDPLHSHQIVSGQSATCNRRNIIHPTLLLDRTIFVDEDNIEIVVRTSIFTRDISLRFEGAFNEAARFDFAAHTAPTATHFWSVEIEDECWRIFTYRSSWYEFLLGVGGIRSSGVSQQSTLLAVTKEEVSRFELFIPQTELVELHSYPRQFSGISCGSYPMTENIDKIISCAPTATGGTCDALCGKGHIPKKTKIYCLPSGSWSEPQCTQNYFMVESGTFEDVSMRCGLRGGHLATPKTQTENEIVTELCADDGSDMCYIGLIRVNSTNFKWIDGSELKFSSWSDRQPSNFRKVLETTVTINAYSGQWGDFGQGELIFPAVCEIGECIPLGVYSPIDPPQSARLPENFDIPTSKNIIEITDGCSIVQATFTGETHSENIITRTWNNEEVNFSYSQQLTISSKLDSQRVALKSKSGEYVRTVDVNIVLSNSEEYFDVALDFGDSENENKKDSDANVVTEFAGKKNNDERMRDNSI